MSSNVFSKDENRILISKKLEPIAVTRVKSLQPTNLIGGHA